MTWRVACLQASLTCASLRVAAKRAQRKRDENSDAGASGAIGRLLVHRLRANQHGVFALSRPPDVPSLQEIGAEPVIADALDASAVKAAVERIRPDVVINELTSLPRRYTPSEMKVASERDHKVRVEGNINLLAALRDAGVRRYLLQSSGFWYEPGAGLADESVPFISSASPGVQAGARTYMKLEARASATTGIEFVALRYGFFYGPGTWYTREGDIGDQVRRQQVPIIGEGQGVYSFVHIDEAAGATAAALECPPGAYNIVDGNPSPQHMWLAAFARAAGAPQPPRISEEEALRASGPDAVYYATRLRGASNAKARRELGFRPRPLEWI
jgi:2-alkyl-3-oxoalkanoate reductase